MDCRRILIARKAAKITQDKLSAELGINRATISKYESGVIEPSISQIEKISDTIGLPKSFFLVSQPFDDLEFLDAFKTVVIYALEKRGCIDLDGRIPGDISDFEYWKLVADNIVNIDVSEDKKNNLSIHFKNSNFNKGDDVLFSTNLGNINQIVEFLDVQDKIKYASSVLTTLTQLNKVGCKKAVERVEELTEIPRYRAQQAPQSPPAPTEGTDTTPPPDAPETVPAGE